MIDLHGKKALITGSSRRIGKSIALALASQGADIIIHHSNSAQEAQKASDEIKRLGRNAVVTCFDLSDVTEVKTWFTDLLEEHSDLEILINNASNYRTDRYSDISEASLAESMAIHVLSPLAMIHLLEEKRQGSSVVNILDARIDDRDPTHASYHLGKTLLRKMTMELAMEMVSKVRINGVAPGLILPPDKMSGGWSEAMLRSTPMSRGGSVDDVADAVLYLCRADFITGQIINVDGGRHLKGLNSGPQ